MWNLTRSITEVRQAERHLIVNMATENDKVPSRLAGLKRGNDRTGVPNKNTKAIKEMILGALNAMGGEAYLCEQADKNPVAFMGLVGKVLPMQLNADISSMGEALNITVNLIKKNAG